jgi:hypothetical protein
MSKVLVLYYSSYGHIEAMAMRLLRERGGPAHTLTSSTVVTAIPRFDLIFLADQGNRQTQ